MAGRTLVVVQSMGTEYPLPGLHWTVDTVKATFADSVPGINTMDADEATVNGDKVITFRIRTGTKG